MNSSQIHKVTRQPVQVLVLPFRRDGALPLYCILRRFDHGYWQFVAGGVELNETPEQAARREAFEEAGIPLDAPLIALDSVGSMPANIFSGWEMWPQGTYIVKEFAFGIEVRNEPIILSPEHSSFKWCGFHEALSSLKWDSNKTALWELSQRLKNLG